MGGSANQQDKSLTRTYRVRDNKNNIKKKKSSGCLFAVLCKLKVSNSRDMRQESPCIDQLYDRSFVSTIG